MSWRDTIKKEAGQTKLRVAPHWKNTIRPEPPKVTHGKDAEFVFEDHKEKISKILKGHVSDIKPQLLNQLSQLVKDQVALVRIPKPKDGQNGKDANRFHLVSSLSDDFGQNDDLALMEKTFDLFVKKDNEWILKGSLKQRESKTLVTGGVSESFVTNAINLALADSGGPSGEVVRETTTDYTLTNETVLLCLGTNPINVTVNGLATVSTLVRNFTNQQVTVLGGTFYIGKDDAGSDITDTAFIIPRGAAFTFTLKNGNFYAY